MPEERGDEGGPGRFDPERGRADGVVGVDQATTPLAGATGATEAVAKEATPEAPEAVGTESTGTAEKGPTGSRVVEPDPAESTREEAAASATRLSDDATQRLHRGDDSEARARSGKSESAGSGDPTATMNPPRAEPTRPARPAKPAAATAAQRERTTPRRSPAQGTAHRTVRRHATVRRVDPWSVLKLSLIFYFCLLLVVMLGLTVFWTVVNQVGIVDQLLGFLEDLQFVVSIDGGMIARAIFLIGLLNVVLWSGINVFLAFLYNLVADLVGGLRVTLAEDQRG